MTIVNIAAAAVSIIIVIYNIVTSRKNKNAELRNDISDKTYRIILFIGIVVALFVRIYKFAQIPYGVNQDGAMAAVDAKALAEYGTDRFGMDYPVHLTAWRYGQMSSLLSYLMIPFIKLFGMTAFSIRLPSLIISCVGLIALFFLAKDSFGKEFALIAFLFSAINPWHIMQSRWALDCNLFPHFFIIGIFFLNRGLNKKIYLYISMVFFGLSMYCYGISIYTIPLFLLSASIYLLVTKKLKLKHILISALIYFLIAWPFIATMVINTFGLPSFKFLIFTIPYFPESQRSSDILFFSDNIFGQIFKNCLSLGKCIILQTDNLPWNTINGFGTIYLFSTPFFILGIYKIFKNKIKNSSVVFILIMLLTALFSGIITNNVNINRLNILYYPLIFITSIGIYYTFVDKKFFRNIVALLYVAIFAIFSCTYFTSYAEETKDFFYKDFQDAIVSVSDDKCKIHITSNVQTNNTANVSEILTLFHIDADAKYFQGEKKIDGKTFKEKYSFENIKDMPINTDNDSLYIVRESEKVFFDKSIFTFEKYGRFYVVKSIGKTP